MVREHLTDSKGMAGSVGVTSLNGFHHHLQELLPAVLKLMIESINVTDGHDRNNDPDKTKGTEAQPKYRIAV